MNEFLVNMVSALIGGGAISTVGGVILSNFLNRRDKEREQLVASVNELTKNLESLKKERIEKIEFQVFTHIAEDRKQETLTKLDNIIGRLAKAEDKADRMAEGVAELRTSSRSQQSWLSDISKELREHVKEDK